MGRGAVEHCHLEGAPADDAEDGDEVDEALRGPELGIFGLAAGFQDFMKHFDLPAQCIPLKFLGSAFERSNWKIGDQLPIERLSVSRLTALVGMNDRQLQRGILLLLSDRRQELKFLEFDLKDGNTWVRSGLSL